MDEHIREALDRYIGDLVAHEDDALRWAIRESQARGLPQIHIRADEGRMLQFLLKAVGARRAVEVGTLAGYSGTWIARALPAEGRLITLEFDPAHAEVARETFRRAGVAGRVEIRIGAALESLKALAGEGPFDAVFIDADRDHYPDYLAWGIEHVRPGGLIAAHNAFFRGAVVGVEGFDAHQVEQVKALNQSVAGDPRLFGTIIPIGDGIAAAIRL